MDDDLDEMRRRAEQAEARAEHAAVRCGVLVEFLVIFGSHPSWCRRHRPGASGDDCDCPYGQAIGMYRGEADRVLAERDAARSALAVAAARSEQMQQLLRDIRSFHSEYRGLSAAWHWSEMEDRIDAALTQSPPTAPAAAPERPEGTST